MNNSEGLNVITSTDIAGNGRRSTRPGRMLRSFRLGRILATPGVLQTVSADEIRAGLSRHAQCDWGELSDEDRQENDNAVDCRLRILSAYRSRSDVKFWIITEADRSATTVLLPDEY